MSLLIESATSPESANIIRTFLQECRSGVLATSDTASHPHAAVVYYTLDEDFSLIIGTKSETQKYKNIQDNKQVSFVVYNEKDQTTVQINGRMEVIEDPEMRQKVVNKMFTASAEQSQREVPPADKLIAGEYVALRLVPMVISMAIYARPDSEDIDDLHEKLLFSDI